MFEKTPIEGLLVYSPKVFHDERGYFFESFNQNHFTAAGLEGRFVQDNCSSSVYGTLRGLHFQRGEHAQAKLVGVLRGSIFDVAVDLRPQSSSYGQWFGMTLTDNNPKYLYIPRGFAHGFLALSPTAEVSYKVDNAYNKASEGGLRYDDPDIAISWPHTDKLVLSDKDRALPGLKELTR